MLYKIREIKKMTDKGEIIGDWLGEEDLKSMPKIGKEFRYKNKKYVIQFITKLNDGHGWTIDIRR